MHIVFDIVFHIILYCVIGQGTENRPYIDAHPTRYPLHTPQHLWIGSYANEPSVDEGPPNCDIAYCDADIRRNIKKYTDWPIKEVIYCLRTNCTILAGTAITTNYFWNRSPYQKGYTSWMDQQKQQRHLERPMTHNIIVDYNARIIMRQRTIKRKKIERSKSLANLRRGNS